jgi:hypothetical protein
MYTGLPNFATFQALANLMSRFQLTYYSDWTPSKISRDDQLLMTLMKLRMNMAYLDLAVRFNCSASTVCNITVTFICALHEILCKIMFERVPSLIKNQGCMPNSFASFTNCRMIIDCTEVYIEKPGQIGVQNVTYSNYKKRNTLKCLVGVAPNGAVTFVSSLYCGSASDKAITQDCGVLSHLQSGDLILADKGFVIFDILPEGVSLNIPPFLNDPSGQFTKEQALATRTIARARIHVERAIERIKGYHILDLLPQQYRPLASKIFQVCAALTNLQSRIIRNVDGFEQQPEVLV